MDNLRTTIDTLFSKINSSLILEKLFTPCIIPDNLGVSEEMFCPKYLIDNQCYTNDQVRELYHLLKSEWMKSPILHLQDNKVQKDCLFHILLHFGNSVLSEREEQPICKYNHLFRWRTLAYQLGEDLFTTSFLAFRDLQAREKRTIFRWPSIIKNDNPSINHVLEQGITDLHYHFRGSSLNYELNWMSLMNRIENRKIEFDKLEQYLSPQTATQNKEAWDSLYLATTKACAIRLYLFFLLKEDHNIENLHRLLFQILKCNHEVLIQDAFYLGSANVSLQSLLDYARFTFGYKQEFGLQSRCLDYAIPMNNEKELELNNLLLSGERCILYQMFHRIFSGQSSKEEQVLFYAYLLQKARIRKELIQLNNLEGFGNFSDFETRKEHFIEEKKEYKDAIPKLAVEMSFSSGNLKYLECRITPKGTSLELWKSITYLDRMVGKHWNATQEVPYKNEKGEYQFYYILHFIKQPDTAFQKLKKQQNEFFTPCQYRHFSLRKDVREKGVATLEALRRYPTLRDRSIGMDAANTELYCRPEVFAPIFRHMKRFGNFISPEKDYSLQYTYHAGEDFWDVADGLRAIEESILFLNLEANDRIGHGLALGIDVEAYYHNRNNRVVMCKQHLMDNAMWLLCKAEDLNIDVPQSTYRKLNDIFCNLYDEIFLNSYTRKFPKKDDTLLRGRYIRNYYQSWLLRGDDPEYYKTLSDTEGVIDNPFTKWDITALNHFEERIDHARIQKIAVRLYKLYHFDWDIRRIGEERTEMKLDEGIVQLIKEVQHKMCHEIAKKHLGIEANLTSNRWIGSMKKYVQHPITRLYQIGLPSDCQDKDCPQMSVSINTDDRGIFDTSIEEEYALLALAVEKEVNSDGTPRYSPRYVYEWLDNIRKVGFEQRFRKK